MRPDLEAMSEENLRLHEKVFSLMLSSREPLTSTRAVEARLDEYDAIYAELAARERMAGSVIEHQAAADWFLRNGYNLADMQLAEVAIVLMSWARFWTLSRTAYLAGTQTREQLLEWDWDASRREVRLDL